MIVERTGVHTAMSFAAAVGVLGFVVVMGPGVWLWSVVWDSLHSGTFRDCSSAQWPIQPCKLCIVATSGLQALRSGKFSPCGTRALPMTCH
jgi:hypothetical protein